MDFNKQSQSVISLCSGMRGIERGLERAGVNVSVKCYVEREGFVIENLVQQMEQGILGEAPIFSDLIKFPSRLFRNKIHGITGGIPCQPASVAGARKGDQDERWLWGYTVTGENSIVGTIRPLWCFFENVPGLISIGYRKIRSDLEQLGYTVEEGIFSAEEVGAPHQRKRLFILAVDNAHRERFKQEYEIQTRWNSAINASKARTELGNSTSAGFQESGFGGKRKLSEEIEGGIYDRFEQPSNELANPGSPRSEIGISGQKQREKGNSGIIDNNSLQTRWPARPGQSQYEWEEPRVEPGMGLTAHGYNYREDLLRMAGNGVVEQAAEKAWITLWGKILC